MICRVDTKELVKKSSKKLVKKRADQIEQEWSRTRYSSVCSWEDAHTDYYSIPQLFQTVNIHSKY